MSKYVRDIVCLLVGDTNKCETSSRLRNSNRLTESRTDRKSGYSLEEQDYLSRTLRNMASSSQGATSVSSEDESDYMNLWDSKSGPTRDVSSAFGANEHVMSSLMREKVGRHNSRDFDRRKAWLSEEETDSDAAAMDAVNKCFDMDKFESLKARVEELDLKLTDFEPFSDLKHSFSLLELHRSTTVLSPPSAESKLMLLQSRYFLDTPLKVVHQSLFIVNHVRRTCRLSRVSIGHFCCRLCCIISLYCLV